VKRVRELREEVKTRVLALLPDENWLPGHAKVPVLTMRRRLRSNALGAQM
jgi:hypothetical protein